VGHLSDDELKDRVQADAVGGPQPGEVYEHYRGGIYSVVCRSIKEDTLESLVTYHSNLKGTNWTRTVENFEESVEMPDGRKRPRFLRVDH
jgi:hypothetical protein